MILGRDSLGLTHHWHSDCRLEQELPDENIVRTSFITDLVFGTAAFGVLLFFGWLSYSFIQVHSQIRDWDMRIADRERELREIQRMQREYVREATQIDDAYGVIRPSICISQFLAEIGSTLPTPLVIDGISYNETGVAVRGSVRESSEKATQLLGGYVEALRKLDKDRHAYREILLTSLERAHGEDMMNFEISFRLQPLPPL